MIPEFSLDLQNIIFYVIAFIAILSGLGVVLAKDPVRSVISLVINFFIIAFMYFGMQAHFLGIIQIAVYIGAIMVLFLFVIMLLNLVNAASVEKRFRLTFLLLTLILLGLVSVVVSQVLIPFSDKPIAQLDPSYGSPQSIGKVLLSQYVWPFEIASVLLLAGVVGSILLAKRRF